MGTVVWLPNHRHVNRRDSSDLAVDLPGLPGDPCPEAQLFGNIRDFVLADSLSLYLVWQSADASILAQFFAMGFGRSRVVHGGSPLFTPSSPVLFHCVP